MARLKITYVRSVIGQKPDQERTVQALGFRRLNRFEDGAEIQPESLLEAGLVKDVGAGIKVLGTGDLKRKLVIHAHQFSAEARRKIEAAGGTAAVIEMPAPIRPKTKRAKNQPKPAAPADAPQPAETPESAPTAAPSGKAEKKQKAAKPTGKSDQPAPNASNSADSPKPQKGKKKG